MNIDAIVADLEGEDEAARRAAVLSVVRLGEESVPAIPVLQRMATEDRSTEIRYLARKALRLLALEAKAWAAEQAGTTGAETGQPKSAKMTDILSQESIPVLAAKINSRHANVRASALRAAAIRQDPALIPVVHERMGSDNEPDPELRALQVRVLAILGGRDELKTVITFLEDPDPLCRATAVRVLAQYRDVAAYFLIVRALLDPDPKPQAVAASILSSVGAGNVLKICELMYRSERIWAREAAIHCLSSYDYPGSIPTLKAALFDPEEDIRLKAYQALERLQPEGPEAEPAAESAEEGGEKSEAIPVGEAVSRDGSSPDPVLRRQASRNLLAVRGVLDADQYPWLQNRLAVEDDGETLVNLITAVGRLSDPRAVELLEKRFHNHSEETVRAAIADALGSIATDAASRVLVTMLEDPSPVVRGRILVNLKGESTRLMEELTGMSTHSDPRFRTAAIYAIMELGDVQLVSLLERLGTDPDPDVAALAQDAREFVRPASASAPPAVPASMPATGASDTRGISGAEVRSDAIAESSTPMQRPPSISRVRTRSRSVPTLPAPPRHWTYPAGIGLAAILMIRGVYTSIMFGIEGLTPLVLGVVLAGITQWLSRSRTRVPGK